MGPQRLSSIPAMVNGVPFGHSNGVVPQDRASLNYSKAETARHATYSQLTARSQKVNKVEAASKAFKDGCRQLKRAERWQTKH